jgi:hypothetical protein
VIAAELTNDSPDFGLLEPLIDAALAELAAIGRADMPEVVLADAGYWHHEQMDNLTARGLQLLVAPDAGHRKPPRPGRDKGRFAFMRSVLQSELGAALYGQRKALIEPVFGHTKFNRRIDRFQRRGIAACRSEWRLICLTHNLAKLHRHQLTITT